MFSWDRHTLTREIETRIVQWYRNKMRQGRNNMLPAKPPMLPLPQFNFISANETKHAPGIPRSVLSAFTTTHPCGPHGRRVFTTWHAEEVRHGKDIHFLCRSSTRFCRWRVTPQGPNLKRHSRSYGTSKCSSLADSSSCGQPVARRTGRRLPIDKGLAARQGT